MLTTTRIPLKWLLKAMSAQVVVDIKYPRSQNPEAGIVLPAEHRQIDTTLMPSPCVHGLRLYPAVCLKTAVAQMTFLEIIGHTVHASGTTQDVHAFTVLECGEITLADANGFY